ncbi:MAG: 4Fe-4S dicluster domain-containing protein [Magnetospirillum sp.]|nr:4Fe-4S dicluster domain-containing protein [Magnetospirillum sp.]
MTDTSRRAFLQGTAVAAVTLAPGLTLIATAADARPAGEAASPKQRWGLLIDTTKCPAECTACIDSCKEEMGLPDHGRPATDAQYIRKVSVKDPASGKTVSLPVMCQHCAKPACVDVCPTGASMKRADGIVLVDRHICIGCRFCMMACPYKARSFIHEDQTGQKIANPRGKGCVEGCTLCAHRVDAGEMPACTEACQNRGKGAMVFGDLNDPASEIAVRVATEATTRIRADLKLDPAVRYQGI